MVREGGQSICVQCGLAQPDTTYFVNAVDAYYEPIQVCMYQRKKRFADILQRIMFPTLDKKDEPVYKLIAHRTYTSVDELKETIRNLPIKDKRYSSIHAFCKLLVRDHKCVGPPALHIVKRVKQLFTSIETLFLKENSDANKSTPFFNYNWLIRRILHFYNIHEYDAYIKKIKCPRRNAHYESMFMRLHTRLLDRDTEPASP